MGNLRPLKSLARATSSASVFAFASLSCSSVDWVILLRYWPGTEAMLLLTALPFCDFLGDMVEVDVRSLCSGRERIPRFVWARSERQPQVSRFAPNSHPKVVENRAQERARYRRCTATNAIYYARVLSTKVAMAQRDLQPSNAHQHLPLPI
jgi:hypothetical protein